MPHRSSVVRIGLFVGLVVVLVVLIVAAVVIADSLSAPSSAKTSTIPTSGRTRGYADAKVTLVEYSDFQ